MLKYILHMKLVLTGILLLVHH